MKKIKLTAVMLSALMLASCSNATSTTTETSESESETTTIETTVETSAESSEVTTAEETTAEETTAESSEETSEETSDETTAETSGAVTGESVEYKMKHVDLDENGNLPDGAYFVYDYNIHSTFEDGWFDVYSYYYLEPEDVAKLKVGDKIFVENDIDVEYIEEYEDEDRHNIRITEYSWFLKEQKDGRYFLDDGTDYTYTCLIDSERKIEFAPDVVIYDGADVYTKNGVKISEYSVKYDSVADFYADLKSENSLGDPTLQLVIKDGVITEMYINPPLHEGWIIR